MDEWVDSEFEDSPMSHDGNIGGMFSHSPNNSARKIGAQAPGRAYSVDSNYSVDSYNGGRSYSVDSYDGGAHPSRQAPMAHQLHPQAAYQDVPVRMVPETIANGGLASKRIVIRNIQEQSLKMLTMRCQAVVVRGVSGSYHVYHVEITSDFYKQKWVVCKRYSEFYRLRKKLLARLMAHKKARGCASCDHLFRQLRDFGFPKRFEMFQNQLALVAKRTSGLEEFIVALCQYMAGDGDMTVCPEITSTRFMVKEFLLFPLEHEMQHVRAIRQLKYVDPRDVQVDTESCPICLCDWGELDGNQLVLSPCGHFFHEHCINEWYRTRFDCPMCRTIAGQEHAS
ncbi:Zinc finger-containing, partial [Globisporangium splendens]